MIVWIGRLFSSLLVSNINKNNSRNTLSSVINKIYMHLDYSEAIRTARTKDGRNSKLSTKLIAATATCMLAS